MLDPRGKGLEQRNHIGFPDFQKTASTAVFSFLIAAQGCELYNCRRLKE
jgi:hypothetical protein